MAVEMARVGIEYLTHERLGRRCCRLAGEGCGHVSGKRVVGLERKQLAIRGQRRGVVTQVLLGIGQVEASQRERGIA